MHFSQVNLSLRVRGKLDEIDETRRGYNICLFGLYPHNSFYVAKIGLNKADFKKEHVLLNRVFSHNVTAAALVSQNNETAAMFVFQTNPVIL